MENKPLRLQSLDTLRGFDMFWITGGEQVFHALAHATGWGWAIVIAGQLVHPEWNGLKAYDCIFPLFLFMAGVSTPFSFSSRLSKGVTKTQLLRKSIRRGLILVLLGIIANNGLFLKPLAELRYASVLGRIGLAGMFAQIIYLYLPKKNYLWVITGAILIIYWLFILFFPVPGCPLGEMTMACNPASYLDRLFLPGHLYLDIHDPEGLASTFPAIATGLLGILAGIELQRKDTEVSPGKKVLRLAIAGLIILLLGIVWNTVFPINKNLWTSSFVLTVGGISLLLLSLFYGVIDVLNFRKWTFFFVVIGVNSIVIYIAHRFIDFQYTANALFGGLLQHIPKAIAPVGEWITYIAVQWALMYTLFCNKWFLKV